ncbi:hypothetical protein BH09VER1_BH09VER1_05450 [soil metagenome]
MINRFSRRVLGRGSWVVAVLIALDFTVTSSFAQVNYVRDIAMPTGSFFLSTTQSPFDAGGTNSFPYLTTDTSEYYVLDRNAGQFEVGMGVYPSNLKLNNRSVLAWVGQGSEGPFMLSTSPQRSLQTYYAPQDTVLSSPLISVVYASVYSIAAPSIDGPVSIITSSGHYTVDNTTGTATLYALAGVNTASAKFMSYGADGLLYVLDYGNNQMDSFDPDNAFAAVTSFNLNTDLGTVTANEQFAIGINGSFYLGDGTGGGSYYNSLGVFQGVFNTGGATGTAYTGQSFINTDATGGIYVYNNATGLHQYQDTSVVPEPSTWTLFLLGGLGLWVWKRRRTSRRAMAALIAFGFTVTSSFAQVNYVRELVGTTGIGDVEPILNISQAPFNYSATPSQTIFSQTRYFQVNSVTGVVSSHTDLPDGMFLAPDSVGSIEGQGSSTKYLSVLGAQGEVFTVNLSQNTITYKPVPFVDFLILSTHSMAALSQTSADVSLIYADDHGITQLAMVSRETGHGTVTSVMSGLGTGAFFQSFSSDGILHVLDYSNNKMVSFDPSNNFEQIGEFNLQSGITTANIQFAIGATGNFYLGDGLGGGSTYDAAGHYLNSFALPEDFAGGDPYTGASYLSSDAAGRVYVYDSATGFHQYQDTSVVPEPSTYALAIGGLLGALILRRRWQRA